MKNLRFASLFAAQFGLVVNLHPHPLLLTIVCHARYAATGVLNGHTDVAYQSARYNMLAFHVARVFERAFDEHHCNIWVLSHIDTFDVVEKMVFCHLLLYIPRMLDNEV